MPWNVLRWYEFDRSVVGVSTVERVSLPARVVANASRTIVFALTVSLLHERHIPHAAGAGVPRNQARVLNGFRDNYHCGPGAKPYVAPMSLTTERSRSVRPLSLASLGAILGMAYGYLEAAEILVLGRIPGVLAWDTGNAAHIAWFGPVFYLVVGFLCSLPFAAFAAVTRRKADTVMVFCFATGGAWLGASVAGHVIAKPALVMLSLGLGTVVSRFYRSHGHLLEARGSRLAAALIAGVPLAATAVVATYRIREEVAYARLVPAPAGAPNVLFLVLDTQRADHLGAYGYARPTSPNIDALASGSVLYEQAFSASSWTFPSHASFFTGLLPQEHRAGAMRHSYLDRQFPTVAEAFESAGYATGAFIANGYWVGRQTGLNRGFIRFEDFYGNAGDAVTRTALGRIAAYPLRLRLGLIEMPGRKRVNRINSDFLEWTEGLNGRPFMAFLNYFDVHGPLLPPPPFEGRFAGGPVLIGKQTGFGALDSDMGEYSPEQIQEAIDRYDESLLSLDAGIGNLIESLRSRGLLDRTIIVLTSDHGESFGEHGMMFHGHSMFRDQIHVPLVIRVPGGTGAGTRVSQPVGTERLASTMLALAGVPQHDIPGEPLPMTDDNTAPEPVFGGAAKRSTGGAFPTARGWVTSVVSGSYHFILMEDGTRHVYALSDHQEVRDLAASPELADSVRNWVERYRDSWSAAPRR